MKMDRSWGLILALVIQTTYGMQPAIIERLQPQGIRFTVQDDGYRMIAVHFNINSPLSGVKAATHNYDVTTKTGTKWIYENRDIVVNPGDTINYWLYNINRRTNQGQTLTDQSFIIPVPTTPAPQTQAPQTQAPQTQAPRTQAPQTQAPQTQAPGTQAPGTQVPQTQAPGGNTPNPTTNPGTNTGGTGTCNPGICTGGSSRVQCTSYPCLIFEDNFDFLNFDVWEHEITASGGGNWEFQYYTNNRSNSYTHDGILFIKPTLTSDKYGEAFLSSGTLDLNGNNPGDKCTGPQFWGCSRQGSGTNIVNPIQSARLRSTRGLTFKYGKVEIEAKMPKGDWLWPAIWMLPEHNAYGTWPASGEIDIVEARGNRHYTDDKGGQQGYNHMGSTLHFGPDFYRNAYEKAHAEKTVSGNLADSWHKYGLQWDENSMKFFLDGAEILNVTPDSQGFWKLGGLDKSNVENPWRYATKMAPFDQKFYLVLNVAVGGTAYFPDKFRNTPTPKPWSDKSNAAAHEFWTQKNNWYPTWNPHQNNGEDAAMKINYIKVWKMKP